jgi:hypothetical protein
VRVFVKTLVGSLSVVFGSLWLTGYLDAGYAREVERTPAQVMRGLGGLDVRRQPGSPGTDPAQSGGVRPLYVVERGEDRISFVVKSGDKVATRMTAHLNPIDEGRRTRVTASVERGDAPEEFVSPVFRSEGLTLALFTLALDDELNRLVAPPRRSREECAREAERLLAQTAPGAPGVGGTAKTILQLHAVEGELRRYGCDTGPQEFQHTTNGMGGARPR